MDIISKWHTAQVIYHYLEGTIPEKDSKICRPAALLPNKGPQTQTQYTIDTTERRRKRERKREREKKKKKKRERTRSENEQE